MRENLKRATPNGPTPERSVSPDALAASENRLRLALEATDACAWDIDPASGLSLWDAGSEALVGLTGTLDCREALARIVHPADLPQLLAAIAAALDPAGDGRFQVEHRILGPAGPRWFQSLGRARFARCAGVPSPRAERLVCVTRDIHQHRTAEERQALLVAELNHRVKNTLANVLALVEQTRRSADQRPPGAPERRRFHTDLQGRLQALARTHDLLTLEAWSGVGLMDLVGLAVGPFAAAEGPNQPARIRAAGPALRLAPQAAVSLAMALHELGGNAIRYGALSRSEGWVSLDWSIAPPDPNDAAPDHGTAAVRWREHGGPALTGPPARRGFGARLLERGVARQFGGRIGLEFPAEGLVCHMRLPLRPATIMASGAALG